MLSTHFIYGYMMSVKEGTKEMFDLTTHSTHFYLRFLYGGRQVVKDLIAREETCCCQQGFFYMHHPTDRIIHTTAFVIPVVEQWLE